MSVLVKIQLEGNQSKTLKLELKTTIAETIKTIEAKTRIPTDPSHAIYLPGHGCWADPSETLESYNLQNMATIEFKKKLTTPAAVSRSFSTKDVKKWMSMPAITSPKGEERRGSKSPRNGTVSITEVTVKTEFVEETITRIATYPLDSTVGDVVSDFLKKANKDPEHFMDYAFFVGSGKSRVQMVSNRKLNTYDLSNNDVLSFERFQIRVRVVKPSGDKISFIEKVDCKVQELMNKIISTIPGAKAADYYFYLPSKHSGGVKLDLGRTLLSYRMAEDDVLELRKAEDPLMVSTKAEDENNLYLVIEAPSHGVVRTVLLASNLTVAEAIARFTKKNPVGNTSNYCLFTVAPNGDHQKMELLFKLSFYQLKNKDRLIFKEVQSTATPNSIKLPGAAAVDPTGVFGVDPGNLEQAMDKGFKVPKFLVYMRKSIYRHKGLQEEGIFRIAGEDGINTSIKKQLNAKTFTDTDEVHCVATLLKRWFGELPKRILAGVPPSYFNEAADNDDKANMLPDKISEPEKSYLLWFIEVLLDVSFFGDVNKMTCASLAIVVGPVLADINMLDPVMSLTLTSKVVSTLQRYMSLRLKEKKETGYTPVIDTDENVEIIPSPPNSVPVSLQAVPSPPSWTPVSPRRESTVSSPRAEEEAKAREERERQKVEQERAEQERLERERQERERQEQERLDRERQERERQERERADRERIERERQESEIALRETAARLEKEKQEKERAQKEQLEAEVSKQAQAERERAERERAEKERAEHAERARLERIEAEQALANEKATTFVSASEDDQSKIQKRFTSMFHSDTLYCLEEVLYMLDVLAEDLRLTATGLGITSTGLELLLSLLHDAGKELEVLDLTVLDGGIDGGLETLVNAMAGRELTYKKLIIPAPTPEEAKKLVDVMKINPSMQISFLNASSYRILGTALKERGMASKAIEYYRIGMEQLRQQKT
eukprot:TRINITY_DN9409_c0_g1_i1.p1 TRINITY_DN9409_c0_g1~~TRINITY_DN9409_c0_g1_i1.p1  ORF type:complete len:950 (+),score=228.33 TRINITY_DN9409_c0_g1_i1:356-3205(+)